MRVKIECVFMDPLTTQNHAKMSASMDYGVLKYLCEEGRFAELGEYFANALENAVGGGGFKW